MNLENNLIDIFSEYSIRNSCLSYIEAKSKQSKQRRKDMKEANDLIKPIIEAIYNQYKNDATNAPELQSGNDLYNEVNTALSITNPKVNDFVQLARCYLDLKRYLLYRYINGSAIQFLSGLPDISRLEELLKKYGFDVTVGAHIRNLIPFSSLVTDNLVVAYGNGKQAFHIYYYNDTQYGSGDFFVVADPNTSKLILSEKIDLSASPAAGLEPQTVFEKLEQDVILTFTDPTTGKLDYGYKRVINSSFSKFSLNFNTAAWEAYTKDAENGSKSNIKQTWYELIVKILEENMDVVNELFMLCKQGREKNELEYRYEAVKMVTTSKKNNKIIFAMGCNELFSIYNKLLKNSLPNNCIAIAFSPSKDENIAKNDCKGLVFEYDDMFIGITELAAIALENFRMKYERILEEYKNSSKFFGLYNSYKFDDESKFIVNIEQKFKEDPFEARRELTKYILDNINGVYEFSDLATADTEMRKYTRAQNVLYMNSYVQTTPKVEQTVLQFTIKCKKSFAYKLEQFVKNHKAQIYNYKDVWNELHTFLMQ